MPLSPFSARLSLAAFLAIGAGIGTNLLVMQAPGGVETGNRARAARPAPATDAERLSRLAADASGASEPALTRSAPAAVVMPAAPRGGRRTGEREADARTQRLGSFAPSSGQIAFASLPGADPAEARRATIRSVQQELARRGYEPGPADGAPGLVTRAAVMAYEHDQGLPLTADPSPEVLAHLRHGTSAPGAAIGLDASAPRSSGTAEQVIRAVQQSLGQLGYLGSAPDGAATDETVRAIREFEMDSGLVPSGRISGPLVARLTKQAAGQRPIR